jgi:hypothetical protein
MEWMSGGFRAVIARGKKMVLAEDSFVFVEVEEESREGEVKFGSESREF